MRNSSTIDPGRAGRVRRTRTAALALTLGLALAGGVAPAARAADTVPVLGQWRGASFNKGNQIVLSVHGVRRTEGATVVYWSLGYPDASPTNPDQLDLLSVAAPNVSVGAKEPGDSLGNVVVMDPSSRMAYTPLYTQAGKGLLVGTGQGNMTIRPEPGKAYVAWAALPPLPESLKEVTLVISGRTFLNVPVSEGLLEPQVTEDSPIVGTGWPSINKADISAAGPGERFVFEYTVNSQFTGGALAKRQNASGESLDLSSDVLFAVDKATLTSKAKSAISKAAQQVKDSGATSITVTGHTDSDADDSYNLKLSKARAEAVAKALQPLLPGTVKITTEGKGEKEPIADNTTPDGKAMNRRVTITIPRGDTK